MIKAFSVPEIWIPTEFQTLDSDSAEDSRCKLSGCENSHVSPRALEVIGSPSATLLRDHWSSQDNHLRKDLGELHDVRPDKIFLTSGALNAIRYAFDVFVTADTRVGILRPDFPGFRHFAEHSQADIHYLDKPGFPFTFSPDDVIDFVRAHDIDFLILSNPSATTGVLWEVDEVTQVLVACPDTLFVIDEADSIHPGLSAAHLAEEHDNCLVLQSFSKFYGLSGLRIGNLITPEVYRAAFSSMINPAELTSVAILAAQAALSDTDYQQETQRMVAASLATLRSALASTKWQLVETPRCFASYVWAPEPEMDPFEALQVREVDIVPARAFGLERGGRINLSDPGKISRLADEIKAMVPTMISADE
jgi:histidinol-phosphate aminotransferase